jgi:integrase
LADFVAEDARDAAATTWAIAKPAQIGIARDLLAHADLQTTTKYYNRAKGIEASRAHNRLIARLRGRSIGESDNTWDSAHIHLRHQINRCSS